MAHIRVIHDPVCETLTVYWAEPRADHGWGLAFSSCASSSRD
jgi:hypothetical protein